MRGFGFRFELALTAAALLLAWALPRATRVAAVAPPPATAQERAEAQMEELGRAVRLFEASQGELPASFSDLTADRRFLQRVPRDPWGREGEFVVSVPSAGAKDE